MYHLNYGRLFKTGILVALVMAVPQAFAAPILLTPMADRTVSHASPPESFDLIGGAVWTFSTGSGSFAVATVTAESPDPMVAGVAGNILTFTYQQGQIGDVDVTVTATDGIDLGVLQDNFRIRVTNEQPKVITSPSDQTVNEAPTDRNVPLSTLGMFEDGDMVMHPGGGEVVMITATTDNPSLMVWDGTPVFLGANLGFTIFGGQSGSTKITVRATDAIGDFVETSFQVTVDPVNFPPVLSPIGNQITPEGATLNFTAVANDPNSGDKLAFLLDPSAPAGASIDPTTGEFTWTPTEAQGPGVFPITVRVRDDGAPALEDFETFNVSVGEVNTPPVLDPVGDQTIAEGVLMTGTATAKDADLPANTLTYSLTTAPPGASITPTGDFTWTPTEAQGPGIYPVTVEVSDGTATDSLTFNIEVTEVNTAPVIAPVLSPQNVDELTLLSIAVTADDSADIPENNLNFTLDAAPPGATITGAGLFEWTPTEAQGPCTYLVTVRVTDDGTPAASSTMSFDVDVTEVNEPPVLDPVGDQNIDEGLPLAFTATASDPDLPANTLTFGLTGEPVGANITAGGDFTWTPTEAQGPGSYTFSVDVTDGALTDSETITVTVGEINTPPVLTPVGPRIVNELDTLNVLVSAEDSADVPSNNLTYALVSGPPGATMTPAGNFSWTPSEAQGPGIYSVTVSVTDDGIPNETVTNTFDITVNEQNVAPVLAPIGDRNVDEGAPLTFTATATDSDIPVQTLTFSLVGAPAGASITAGGDFSWTPAENQGPGVFPVTVRVTDGQINVTEIINVTVGEVNEAPVLAPIGNRTIGEGSWLTFDADATDADLPANVLTYSIDGGAPGAAIDPVTGVFGWTPTEAQGPGTYTVTVTVTDDSTPVLSASEVITIDVTESNIAPTLTPIGDRSVDELAPLAFTATAADADVPANILSFTLDAGAPTGASITAGGDFTWTPTEAQGPGVYPVTIRVTDDGSPSESTAETINITVGEVNQAPVLNPIGDQTVDELTALTFTATADDSPDIPANNLTFSLDSAPPGASITPAGDFSWTPTEAQGPGVYSVTVRVTDDGAPNQAATETFNVTVNDVNEPPVLAPIGDRSIDEETLLTFTASAVDSDLPANTLTYTLEAGAPAGAAIDPVTGVFTWTPAETDGPGTFPVTIRVTDDGAPSLDASEAITITVIEVNDPPFLIPGGDVPDLNMNEDDATATVEVRNQFDDDDLGDTPPDVLNVVVLPGYDTTLATVTVNGTGVDVTPNPHRYGTTTVTVGVEDKGGVQATDTFLLDVASVNDPVEVDAGIVDQNGPEDVGTFSVTLGNAFRDFDLANGGDTHTVTFSSDNAALLTAANSPLADLSGTMDFTVVPNANGMATITVTAEDAAGTQAVTTFMITIAEVTDPPVVVTPLADVLRNEDDGDLTVDLSGTFDDADIPDGDVLTLSVSHDNATLVTSATITGTNLELVIGPDQNGLVNVTVQAMDMSGNVATDTFLVDVTAINDDPTVANPVGTISTFEDDPADIVIDLANVFDDVDILTNGDVLTFTVASNDNSALFDVEDLTGSVLTLSLAFDANGTANIVVQATDTFGATATDVIVVDVTPVNDIPVANDDTAPPISEDSGPVTIAVLDNDYLAEQPTTIIAAGDGGESQGDRPFILDPFGDPIQLDSGTVSIVGNEITYEPAPNFFGTDWFTYEIEDADGDRAEATVTISVIAANDAPVGIQERTFNMYENGTLTVAAENGALVGAYDVDGALLDGSGNPVGSFVSAVITAPPMVGSLTFDQPTGAFEYVPPVNFTGEASFYYRLFDGTDLSGGTEYQIRVVVNPTPLPPVLPNPGQVAINYNVANVPLDQTAVVPPNVLVVMDDSGSMDWNMIVYGADENGGFVLDNSTRTKGKKANISSYVYLWDLPANAYPANSQFGLVLPTDEALAGPGGGPGGSSFTDQEYGLWRARTHLHNRLYYNPEINYQPWIGQDANNDEFADADRNAIRLDPVDPTNTFDMMALHTYKSSQVPEWDNNGGTTVVDVVDLYIPHYWTTTTPTPLPPIDANAVRVDIVPGNTYVGGPAREDCADPMACTFEEEIQNFANWFQYYRTREYVTKGSIGAVISRVQDIRIGYETISATTSRPVRLMNDLYTEGDKKLLLDNVYAVDSYGGTPLRQALGRAGQIFSCATGNDCPALPAPDGQCQQNFALLFTDGYWNGGAGVPNNTDIDGPGVFDGGRYEDNVNATLGDVAMYYYENDIQPTLDDEVPVSRRDLIGVPAGTYSGNNDTIHQHMKTYAIAFGVTGTFDATSVPLDPTVPFAWTDPFSGPREKIDDLVHAATNGRGVFLNASDPRELQQAFDAAFLEFTATASSASAASFNSTSLRSGTLLYRGFYDLRDNTGELTATIVNPNGTLEPVPTWKAAELLNPTTILPTNRTIVTSDPVSGDGIPFRYGSLDPAQQLMMSEAEVDFIRGDRANEAILLRERPATDGLLGDIVNSSPVFVGAPGAINRDQAPYPEDDLYSAFALSKSTRSPIVYVGANDGIMHGFDAALGIERYGFVPNKIINENATFSNDLDEFTSPFYQHRYYVDLTPSLNDVYMRPSRGATGKEWVTILMGGLGGGGKGFFALNVTDPDARFTSEANAASTVLWEFTDEDDTYPVDSSGNPIGGGTWLDPDGRPVKDLGMALSQPTLTMSNVSDGGSPARKEWVAIFGNGLNSTAGIAKLFVLFLDRGVDGWQSGDFEKVDTGIGVPTTGPQAGYPNGLGTVTGVDVDLNGTVDWVYGGDRLGNLYRFDISDPDPANWTSTRLFTATYDDGSGVTTIQPILSAPLVSKHPTESGFLITFGTGSHVAREDNRSQDIQSIYTIWDRGENNPATAQSDTKAQRLVEQVVTNVVDDSVSPAVTRRIVTDNPVDYVSEGGTPGTYGWYVDLDMQRATGTLSGGVNADTSGLAPPDPQFPGEKAIRRLIYRDGNIIATTVLPSGTGTSCFGARPGSIMLFNALTGGNPQFPVVDFNNDGYVDNGDLVEVGGESFAAGILFDQDAFDGGLVDPSILGGEGDTDFLFLSGGSETTSFRINSVNDGRTGRLSWQELD
jgi:Tfp pilus tip-associated adhesin PilY1